MKKRYLFLLALLSGLLLSASWPAKGFPFLLFFSFVPLLYIEDYIAKNKHNFNKASVFIFSYVAFFTWNALTTWWIFHSTLFGVVMAVIFNSLFMAIVFHLYHLVRRTIFKSKGAFNVLIFFWITFEFLHLDWDLSWSWLNLGNGFAAFPDYIQWYEYTGTFGGTLWVLVANILLYKFLLNAFGILRSRSKSVLFSVSYVLVIIIPVAFSEFRYYSYSEKSDPYHVVVVQPNIDPYNEKFDGMTETEQLDKMLKLARNKVDDKTDFLVFPETALPGGIVENDIELTPAIDTLRKLISEFPRLKIIMGMNSIRIFEPGEKLSPTARYSKGGDYYFDVCNTAYFLDKANRHSFYHKSKLVPGVEMMPFPKLLKPLEQFALNLGGMTGSNARQDERSVFASFDNKVKVAPVICYESIYGDFITEYIRNGANFIFIITNDGWWKDTPGHRQHFEYARLRAVETRRSIARSANTGISGFINQRGDVLFATKYWVDDVIAFTINANSGKTFYVRFGDYIGRFSFYISLVIIGIHVAVILLTRRKKIIIFRKKT